MTDDPHDKVGKPVTGVVTAYYPSEGKNDPHNVYISGHDQGFSTFDADTAEPIEEGIKITFRAEKNGQWWNIKEGTVSIVDRDPDTADDDTGDNGSIRNSECVQTNSDGEAMHMFSMNDARIMAQSITRSAVLFHQDREDSSIEDVEETAERFADLQGELVQQLRGVPLEGGA